eukprot:703921-Pelagomonas_calceolata.AAC.3
MLAGIANGMARDVDGMAGGGADDGRWEAEQQGLQMMGRQGGQMTARGADDGRRWLGLQRGWHGGAYAIAGRAAECREAHC